MNPIIEVKSVFKAYKAQPENVLILKDINLAVQKGEFLVIFGPSGSGKSTLLNIILGLEKPTKGRVLFKGLEVTRASEDELAEFRKQNIGLVHQQSYWVKSLNVLENVSLPLILRGYEKNKAEESAKVVLNNVGLKDWSSYHPHELSSGQQQKVSLARALITNPDIIVTDEPTGNLDYNSGQNITAYLRELSDKGKTIIMVTHNLDNLDYAKRVVNILDGRISSDTQIDNASLKNIKQELISNKEIVAEKPSISVKKELDRLMTEQKDSFNRINKANSSSILSSIRRTVFSIFIGTFLVLYKLIDVFMSARIVPGFIRNRRNTLTSAVRSFTNSIKNNGNSISYFDIFNLSFKTLFSKRSRAFITIAGISFGIGFTTFLISVGYGLEQLVVSRSTNLEQLKQIEVYPPLGESIIIDDTSISNIKNIDKVDQVLPIINVAGKVNYQDSNIDVVVYGVQSNYLKLSDFKLVTGRYFENNENELVGTPVSTPVSIETETISDSTREAVVNLAFLSLIGLDESNALGQEFDIGYVPVNNISSESASEIISLNYKIAGIISNTETPIIFTPINEIKKAGIPQYAQARVVVENANDVSMVRQQLNVLGYRTTSVQDTVSQIEGFFSTARVIFAAIGLVALFIGALGMFNTLTISLLERTREVGLLKTIGMKSNEIKDVFISEAIIMGVYGGVAGIIIGLTVGYLASFILSSISIMRGFEALSITHLPLSTALGIILISALTGIATGFYPSRRATKISALDALRYE